jgi:hypothetical protein
MELASEMVIKASLLGLTVVEIPTVLFPDIRDRPPHLRPFRDGWRHLRFLLLFTPTWLFLIPGSLSFLSGWILLVAMLVFDPKTFGIFTMFFAQGLILLGAQVIFLGFTARGFSQLKRLLIQEDPIDRLLKTFTIEKGIALGLIFTAVGLGMCVWVAWELLEFISQPSNLGIFNMQLTKIGTVGTTLTILGFQLIFSSFYSGFFDVEVAEERDEN